MPGQGPELDSDTVFLWNMSDPIQVDQANPLVDQSTAGNLDLTVDVFNDNQPWIMGGEEGKNSFSRGSNGDVDTNERFFFAGTDANRATMLLGDWTMEYRLFLDELPATGQEYAIFVVRGFGIDSEVSNDLMRVNIKDDGSLDTFWEHGGAIGTNVQLFYTSTIVPVGTWFTLSIRGVVSAGSRTVHMYIDGTFTESQTGTNASGGSTTKFSLLARTLGEGGGTADRCMRGRISSFAWHSTDIGASLVSTRASLKKFTELASTWCLHTFPEQPTQRDEAGNYPGMNPDVFTDIAGKGPPDRAQGIVCDGGFSRSFTGGDFLMLPNDKRLRDVLKGEFTIELWTRHHQGQTADKGIFRWYDTASTEGFNDLLDLFLDRQTSTWRPRIRYQRGAGVLEDHLATFDMIDEVDASPSSHSFSMLLSFVFRDNAGTREVDCYRNKTFLGTVVCGAMPTGGEDSTHVRFGTAGSNTEMRGDIDWIRFSDKARTLTEISDTYDRGAGCVEALPDTVSPVVVFVDPPPGTPIQPDAAITVDVTDDTGTFCNVALRVLYENSRPSIPEEVIYTGQRFSDFYVESTKTAIANGFRFVLRRVNPQAARRVDDPGWPATPTFEADPIDSGGNRSV